MLLLQCLGRYAAFINIWRDLLRMLLLQCLGRYAAFINIWREPTENVITAMSLTVMLSS